MKFFSTAWASGDLDDAECENVAERYNAHLATFDQRGEVYRFATTISLNDAYLDRVVVDRTEGSIELLLLTGDLQVGYWHTTLKYGSARIAEGQKVLERGLSSRPTEIWYDEFECHADGMSHAFLLADRTLTLGNAREFRVDFQDFRFSRVKAGERKLTTPDDRSAWD